MTAKTDTAPVAQQAVTELLDLAAATRPDIDQARLHGAILQAQDAEWNFGKILVAVAVMCARGEHPRDLCNAVEANPVRRYTRKDRQ